MGGGGKWATWANWVETLKIMIATHFACNCKTWSGSWLLFWESALWGALWRFAWGFHDPGILLFCYMSVTKPLCPLKAVRSRGSCHSILPPLKGGGQKAGTSGWGILNTPVWEPLPQLHILFFVFEKKTVHRLTAQVFKTLLEPLQNNNKFNALYL